MSRKRGQNEGSISKRPDGLFCAQVTGDNGKRVTKYFHTRKEANEWLQETLLQIKNGLSLLGSQTTFEEYLEHWLETASLTIRPNTYKQYSQIVSQHITPVLGKVKLKDIRPEMIQGLYNSKLAAGTSNRTVILIHCVIHRSLRQAVMFRILGWNPADAVVRPRLPRTEMKVLTDTQVRNLLLVSRGTRYEALLQLAVTVGLRQGEILGLKWSDLDWNTRHLQIQRQVQSVKGKGKVFSEPKSAAGKRLVVLGSGTIEVLRAHWKRQQQERQFVGDRWRENDLMFPTTIGTPGDKYNLLKVFKAFLQKAGLPDIRFHDLRHTAATLMLQQGVNPKIVQERLGHSDISLTLNTYSHVLPSMQEEAAEKIDELLKLIEVHENQLIYTSI